MSLSSRLVTGVTLISALMLSLLVWNSVRLINSSNAELIEQATREKSILLAEILVPGLLYNDRAILTDVFRQLRDSKSFQRERLRKNNRPTTKSETSKLTNSNNQNVLFRDLVYAVVTNRNGKVMARLNNKIINIGKHTEDSSYKQATIDGVFDIQQDIIINADDNTGSSQYMGKLYAGYSISKAQLLTQKTQWQNTSIAIFALLLSIATTMGLGFLITRHMRNLEQGAQALRRGELEHRVPISEDHDFGGLARAFNELAWHLETTQGQLKEKHQALLREKGYLQTLLNGVNAVVWEANPETGRFTYVSQEAENLLGYRMEEWLEVGFCESHLHSDDKQWVLEERNNATTNPGDQQRDFRMLDNSGKIIWVREMSSCDLDANGVLTQRGLFLDVTDEIESEEQVLFLAEHDALTGLINRRSFQNELKKQIEYAEIYNVTGALLFIDLDQFKYINDSYGHQIGDEFLIEISNRLSDALGKSDYIGRLGGDEFGIILPNANQALAENFSSNLLQILTESDVRIANKTLHVSASIGIALFPGKDLNYNQLLAKADTAMYTAKDHGRNQFHIYSSKDSATRIMKQKIRWEELIRDALANNKFILHYQPIVNLETAETVHYEVLLRMINENRVLISPNEFLDTAERFGLIKKIDHWVLSKAIEHQGKSMQNGNPIKIAINLSGRHFGHSELLDIVNRAISFHKADPKSIIFEVTETEAVKNFDKARIFIDALRKIGCRFALDDFGKGYSSYYYLKKMPLDFVKIDGAFIRNLHTDQTDSVFVKALTELAHGFGIITIAECIENEEVIPILRRLGVDLGQGFYMGSPQEKLVESSYHAKTLICSVN